MRGPAEIDGHAAHRKGDAVLHQLGVMHTALAQELGPRPLKEMQVRGMVDVAGEIRVFVVDAGGEMAGGHSSSTTRRAALSSPSIQTRCRRVPSQDNSSRRR